MTAGNTYLVQGTDGKYYTAVYGDDGNWINATAYTGKEQGVRTGTGGASSHLYTGGYTDATYGNWGNTRDLGEFDSEKNKKVLLNGVYGTQYYDANGKAIKGGFAAEET